MLRSWRTVAAQTAFAAAILTASSLRADSTRDRSRSMMGERGMMSGMGQMHGMMEGCRRMMGSPSKTPNDQWRKPAPDTSEKKG